jgi:hypothetical protein
MSQFKQLVVRGDECFQIKTDNPFPYIDKIAEAGATGVHIWFWKEPYLSVKDEFIPYCHDRNIKVHLGIGVGAYDVCNGEDPTDPKVQQKIKDHVAEVLDTQDIDGIEFQTGEYDRIEYKGDSMSSRSHAGQLVDSLNPIIEFTHGLKESLWIRTELLMLNFDEASVDEVSKNLLKCCAVEWSHYLGPFKGENAFTKGKALLMKDDRFSWFLKTLYRRSDYIGAKRDGRPNSDSWLDEWREWVRMLYDANRETLTVCHVTSERLDIAQQAIRASLEIAP